MMTKRGKATFFAILAAVLYAINAPVSKLLLEDISVTMMAALLYLGAGLGLWLSDIVRRWMGGKTKEKPLTRKELPYTIGMVLLDIVAPIFLMIGLTMTTAANASLLNNFEIVATSIIALYVFKESISRRLWSAIVLVTASSMILSFEDISSLSFSFGSLFVLLACVCWGFENNFTRKLSSKNPLEIVVIKGFVSGTGALVIALSMQENIPDLFYIGTALLLGFVSYGLSIFFYIHAQRHLGAAKTSAYYAIAPFVGVIFSLIIFKEIPTLIFLIAFLIMIVGTYLASTEGKK